MVRLPIEDSEETYLSLPDTIVGGGGGGGEFTRKAFRFQSIWCPPRCQFLVPQVGFESWSGDVERVNGIGVFLISTHAMF